MADTLHQISQEVLDILGNPAFSESNVVQWVNRCLKRTVLELARRRVYLPSLATSDELTTSSTAESVALPDDWHDNLHEARDTTTGRTIAVRPWPALQRLRGGGLPRHGQIMAVASAGMQLRYWMVPGAATSLIIKYHRQPTAITALTATMAELPSEFSPDLVLDYCCAEGFARIEQEQNDGRSNTAYHRGRYAEALDALALRVGPWPTEAYEITDAMGWGAL